jgi:hypothetical protein
MATISTSVKSVGDLLIELMKIKSITGEEGTLLIW